MFLCVSACVFACRYNVRDVGFVDLRPAPYAFYCFVDSSTPAEFVSAFDTVAGAGLLDTNIKHVIINVDEQSGHPAKAYLQKHFPDSLPAIIFASQDGRSMLLPIGDTAGSINDKLWVITNDLAASPKREEILDKLISSFAVVLVVNPDENARSIAQQAIDHIASQLPLMPKHVSRPPALAVIESLDAQKERTLLWALDIDAADSKPSITVLYGRGRRMGFTLKDDQLNADTLIGLLSIIGADCECGLDRKWMEGLMFPFTWNDGLKQDAAKALGFDPEDPSVKMEISLILKNGPTTQRAAADFSAIPEVGFGYQEIEVTFDAPEEAAVPEVPAIESQEEIPKPQTVPWESEAESPSYKFAVILLALVIAVVLGTGVFIALRGKNEVK
ncbi:MAG: hypothetical protein KAS23_09500 [Anaerohalosphaera sp.]|nr:hypothetical protein [Anaerohalosphaera sp.]